jgi:carotenoid cleavage dioxygenase
MSSAIETAIRGTITKGVEKVALFNRVMAKSKDGPHPYLTGIHRPMTQELTLEALAVEGELPHGLNGRYLRIGPNPLGQPNPARYHWFTGDGMVHGLRMQDGRALWYRNRWVRTTAVSAALGEPKKPGKRLRESMINTNVIGHAGRYYALVEAGGTPVELDGDLATLAHNPFDGTLQGAFSAHPHRDPATGELHAICYNVADLNHVHHVVVATDGKLRREEPIAVLHGPSIHDCAITQTYVLVFDLPVTFSAPAMLAGYEFPFRWNHEHKARIGLLGLNAPGTDIIWCDVDPCYVYHPCNAYDLSDGRVIVDLAVHNRNGHRDFRGPDGDEIRFERWTIDPAKNAVTRAVIDDTAQEFLRHDERLTGRPYRYAYAIEVAAGAPDLAAAKRLFKHDLATGTRTTHDFGPHCHPGEFVFIPRSPGAAEDDGYLMGLVLDQAADTSALFILDASNIAASPLARINLPHRVPPGFHGNWIPDAPI